MREEQDWIDLERENRELREQVAQRDRLVNHLQETVAQLMQEMQMIKTEVKGLQDQLSKNSHNSSLPPSSDRFVRQPKSLRKKSGKKPGGQPGHPGSHLSFSATPDEVIEQHVERCDTCQHDLQAVAACGVERRQVVDLPAVQLVVREYRAERKICPQCHQMSVASFLSGAQAPIQYGPGIGAIAVYLVQQHLLPLARSCEVMKDLLGVQMSEATLVTITLCLRLKRVIVKIFRDMFR